MAVLSASVPRVNSLATASTEGPKETASVPCVNSSDSVARGEPENAALTAAVPSVNTSISSAEKELREATSILYVNSSETSALKEALRDAASALLVPSVTSSFTTILDEPKDVAVTALVPCDHYLTTASKEEHQEVLSVFRVNNSETFTVIEPIEVAPASSPPCNAISATVAAEEDLVLDSADADTKESVSVELDTPLPHAADSSLAASSAASEHHNMIVCEVPKVENASVLGNLCNAETCAGNKSHATSNVTDLVLNACKVSEDISCESIIQEKSNLDVDDVPKLSSAIDLNTTVGSNVSEVQKKRHGKTPVPKTRKSLCTCGADPPSGTLKKKPPPLHGCGGGATGPALGGKEVRSRSMGRMHDSRYGEITVSVGAYERLLCYGDSLVRLGGVDVKGSTGVNVSRKGQPKVTIESFGVTTWNLPSYNVPVQRNKEEVKPAAATALSAPVSIDILDFNYPENSDGAFNTVKRRPRRAKQTQKEQKSVSSSAKEETQPAKVVLDMAGDASNAVKGVVTENSHEKVTDGLSGSNLNKTSRSPRHKSRKNPTLQDLPDLERSILNLPGASKPIPNLVDNPSGLTQESTDQLPESQRSSGLTQEIKNLGPPQPRQVDQDIPSGDQSAPVHRVSADAEVPVLPVDQFLAASSLVREPQHVDLLIGHTSGSGSMDLCYLRDNEANVEYTLVRRHVCCGNYIGPSEEGRYYRSSAEYMTLGVDDPPKWEGHESRDAEELDLAKSVSYSSSIVDPVKLALVEPSSGYDDLPLLAIGDVIENPLMQGAQNGSEDVNEIAETRSNMRANEAECTKSVNSDFSGITYLDGLKAHLKVINSVKNDDSIGVIPLISKESCIDSTDLLSAKKLDDFSDFLDNIGVVSVSAEPEETLKSMTDFRGAKEKKPEPAYLLELKAKLNIGEENERASSKNEVAVANLIHLEATENSVQESRTERSVKFNGAQIRDEFVEESQVVDYAPQLSDEDCVGERNEAASFYDMPHLMYEYFMKTKLDDDALETLDDQSLGNVIDQETLNESYDAINLDEENAPFQIIKPAYEFSQLFKLEEMSVKSSKCEDKYLTYTESFDEAQYAELSTCHPGSLSPHTAQSRGSGNSDQLFPYNLVIDNPVYSSLGSTSADSTGLFKGMCLANGVHDIELAETESLSKEVVSDEYRNYLQDTDQPSMSDYGAGTMRRSTSSNPPNTVQIQKDFRKKMDRFLTQNIRFHQQPKCNTALSLQSKKSRSGARGSSTDAAGLSCQARPSRHHDSRQSHRYPPAGAQRPEGAGSGIGGFPEQYSARLAEQLRLLMQEESRQLYVLQREQRANLSEGALRDALLDRDIEQDVQREIEALERSLKIKEQQLLQLEEMQLRIQLEQMPSASRVEGSNQRQWQPFREIENGVQQTVFLESSSSSPNIKKTRSEPYLATPSLSGSNHPSDDVGESPATLPRTQSPGRMHEYVNWTPEDVRSLSTSKSKRRSQSSSRRTSSRSVASHTFSSEVLQQLENLRLELQRAEEAIQQRLDGVCIRSRRSTLDTSAESSDERLGEDSGMPPQPLKAGENQRLHKEKHCCRNEKQRHQEEKHSHPEEKHRHQEAKHHHQEEKHRHQEEKHRHHEGKHRHHDEKHHHKDEKHFHRNEKHRHNDEHQRHHAGNEPNDEQLRYHHDEPQQSYVDEPHQHHLEDQRQHLLDEQQQRHRDEHQQRHFDEQQQLLFDESQQHLYDEQQLRHLDEKQHHYLEEQQQEQYRLSDVQHAEQDHQEQTLEQEKVHHATKRKQRSKHQKQHHEPEQKLYENTRHRLPDGALVEDLGEQNQPHICGDEANEGEEKAHSNRGSQKQQHDGNEETRRSRHSKRRDRRNKDDHHQDESGVPVPQSDELLQSHDEMQAYHHLSVMDHWQDQVIAEQPIQFYQQMINDQHVISEQPLKQVMIDHGPEQQFSALPTEQEHEQLELLLLQEQQQKQLMVECYEQEENAKKHHAQQPHVYENQQEHQYEEQRLCVDSLNEQQLVGKHQKQQPIVQHQSAMSRGGPMKPGIGACAGLLRAGFEIGLSTLVSTDQEREQRRVESLAAAPSSFHEEDGTNLATTEKALHGSRTCVEVQPQVLDDDTFHEKFLHEHQDELTRRALAERLTRSVEQLNASGATFCRLQDQLAEKLTVHPVGSETTVIENGRRNDVLKTRSIHTDCQVHGLGRSYPDLEHAQAFRHSGYGLGDVVSGNSVRGVTISAEALLSKHTYVNSQDESSFDPKRDFEAAHQLLLDMESTDPVVPAPAPTKPKRVSYGDVRPGESYSHSKEKLSHQLMPDDPALESRESDPVILGPHLHHSYVDDAPDAKDDQLRNDLEGESPATPSPPPPPAITRQYPANVLQELQLLTLQLQDTERMISRKLDLLVSPPQSRVGSAAPRLPKVHRSRNSHQRVSSLGSTGLTTYDYQNNNNSKDDDYNSAGGAERPRRSNSVGCSDMITAAYCNKARAAPPHKSSRVRVRPKTAPKARQPTSIKGNKATPKDELRSSQEDDGNDSSLCFAHIKKFWEKEKA